MPPDDPEKPEPASPAKPEPRSRMTGLGPLLSRLQKETMRAYRYTGLEVSPEKAQELIQRSLTEVWPEYLRGELREHLGLLEEVTVTTEEEDDGEEA